MLCPYQLEELDDKETRLHQLSDEHNKSKKVQLLTEDKIKRDVDRIRKQLNHERNLKLDAFQRVDELQSQVAE